MIHLAREDVLRGLERFRSIAKQDFLASNLTDNPEFWATQAAARREQYDKLIELVRARVCPQRSRRQSSGTATSSTNDRVQSLSCAMRSKLLRCSSSCWHRSEDDREARGQNRTTRLGALTLSWPGEATLRAEPEGGVRPCGLSPLSVYLSDRARHLSQDRGV